MRLLPLFVPFLLALLSPWAFGAADGALAPASGGEHLQISVPNAAAHSAPPLAADARAAGGSGPSILGMRVGFNGRYKAGAWTPVEVAVQGGAEDCRVRLMVSAPDSDGVDVVYPPDHRKLAAQIAERGAQVSEYPPGTQPDAGNFPPRNRIISGLSLGTLVVEAGQTSGALITARFALEQGRETFAVPGSALSKRSAGTNHLIQAGEAKLVLGVEDVLEELNLTMLAQQAQVRQIVPENDVEARLLAHLGPDPTHIDDLGRAVQLPISQVSSSLALMELKGLVHRVGSMSYSLAREARVAYRVD